MIPRYQKILFGLLLVASLAMTGILWHLRNRAHQRLLAGSDSAPTQAPEVTAAEPATLVVASDADGSLLPQDRALPLPADPGTRARVLLGNLLDLYAAPDAAHPVAVGAAGIAQVFLLPTTGETAQATPGAQLAVVNFTGAFVASHPSGIETETLTLLSICATLRANLPQVVAVRFLVDGQQQPTLAGHADLTRTYLTANAVPSGGPTP
ncbi:MAG: GerMN domain-containing protein [Acidobacteriota bacterium]|nr:GerMN domain-containing protein [Acidobacteriota bacterium]MDE3162732.1 GerMN domain-containing protein [Acidobacteriota bacterium]